MKEFQQEMNEARKSNDPKALEKAAKKADGVHESSKRNDDHVI